MLPGMRSSCATSPLSPVSGRFLADIRESDILPSIDRYLLTSAPALISAVIFSKVSSLNKPSLPLNPNDALKWDFSVELPTDTLWNCEKPVSK